MLALFLSSVKIILPFIFMVYIGEYLTWTMVNNTTQITDTTPPEAESAEPEKVKVAKKRLRKKKKSSKKESDQNNTENALTLSTIVNFDANYLKYLPNLKVSEEVNTNTTELYVLNKMAQYFVVNESVFFDVEPTMLCDDEPHTYELYKVPKEDKSEELTEDDLTEALFITEEMTLNGVIINNNMYLTPKQWHTVIESTSDTYLCSVCQFECNEYAVSQHITSLKHMRKLDQHKPLKRFDLSITRKINENLHCGVCNELFPINQYREHENSKTHEGNLLFAINKVSDLMWTEDAKLTQTIQINNIQPPNNAPYTRRNTDITLPDREWPDNSSSIDRQTEMISHSMNRQSDMNRQSEFDRQSEINRQTEMISHSMDGQSEMNRHSMDGQTELNRHSMDGQLEMNRHSMDGQTEMNRHSMDGQLEMNRHSMDGQTEINRHSMNRQTEIDRQSEFDRQSEMNRYLMGGQSEMNRHIELNRHSMDEHNKNVHSNGHSEINSYRNVSYGIWDDINTNMSRNDHDAFNFGKNAYENIKIYEEEADEYILPIEGVSYASMASKPRLDLPKFLKIDLGTKEVRVKFESWNMITQTNINEFYCMVCTKSFLMRFKTKHCMEEEHTTLLSKCTVVGAFEDYLIRDVSEKLYHCGHCNNLQYKSDILIHIEKYHPIKNSKNIPEHSPEPFLNQDQFKPKNDLTSPRNDLTSPRNDLTSLRNDLTSPRNDLTSLRNDLTKANNILSKLDPRQNTGQNLDPIPNQNQFKSINDLTNPRNDLTSPRNDLTSPRNDLTNPRNDLTSPRNVVAYPKIDIFSDFKFSPFGAEMSVSNLGCHTIMIVRNNYFCAICNDYLSGDIINHVYEAVHMRLMNMTPFIRPFQCNLIRAVRGSLHCAICNVLVPVTSINEHNMESFHVEALARALGMVKNERPKHEVKYHLEQPNEFKTDLDKFLSTLPPNTRGALSKLTIKNPKGEIFQLSDIKSSSNSNNGSQYSSLSNSPQHTLDEPNNKGVGLLKPSTSTQNDLNLSKSIQNSPINKENLIKNSSVQSHQNSLPNMLTLSMVESELLKAQPCSPNYKSSTDVLENNMTGTMKNTVTGVKLNEQLNIKEYQNDKKFVANQICKKQAIGQVNEPVKTEKDGLDKVKTEKGIEKVQEKTPTLETVKQEPKKKKKLIENEEILAPFELDEMVILKLRSSYFEITNSSYHTLIHLGNGLRQCFICSNVLDISAITQHVYSSKHIEKMDQNKFLYNFCGQLLRQIYKTYHCTICNVTMPRQLVNTHLEWPIHKQKYEISFKKLNKKSLKDVYKSGVKEFNVQTQKECIYDNVMEPINIITYIQSTNEEFEEIYIEKKVEKKCQVVILKGDTMKICFESWHGVLTTKNGLKCILCQQKLNDSTDNDIAHLSSQNHIQNLEISFEKEYYPALIRKINTKTANCVICNLELPNDDVLVKEHISGRKHQKKYNCIIETSLYAETNDCKHPIILK